MHSKKELRDILQRYDLGKLHAAKLLYKEWNVAYRIRTDKDTYVLKILKHSKEKDLRNEIYILRHLDMRVPHVLPVRAKNGKEYIKWKGTLAYVTPFIRGRLVKDGSRLTNNELRALGRTLALIHSTKIRLREKNTIKEFDELFRNTNNALVQQALVELKALKRMKLPSGFIHADLHTENMRISQGKIVVFDFEDAYHGPFIYDLGLVFLDTCFTKKGFSKERMGKVLRGYTSLRKLTLRERGFFRLAMIHAGLVSLVWERTKGAPLESNWYYRRFQRVLNSKT